MPKREQRISWLGVGATVIFFSIVTALAALASGLGTISWHKLGWTATFEVLLPFFAFGMLLGTIFALDSGADAGSSDARTVRTVLCSLFGTAIVLSVWAYHPHAFSLWWLALGAVLGAIGGWFGWRWARYVDF